MPHWPVPMDRASTRLGLDNIRNFLELLGNPQNKMPPVIHVAGTNGKGSTVAMLRAIFETAGLKVHAYTSPHLLEFNERIVIAGQKISDDFLTPILEECRIIANQNELPISFFDGTTAAAFIAFSRVKADIVLLETGLGGRIDATNIITKPILTIITQISFDHIEMLGDSIAKIAHEKACIMKPGTPCIVSMQLAEAHAVIEEYAEQVGAPLVRFEYDFGVDYEDGKMIYKSEDYNFVFPDLSLTGDHQYINAASVITAVKLLKGVKINDEQIRYGLSHTNWPGRLQHLTRGKLFESLPKTWEIWLDGAHNEAGTTAVANWLSTKLDTPVFIIMGITRKRDIKKLLRPLKNVVTKIIGVSVKSEPLSYLGQEIATNALELGFDATGVDDIEDAADYLCKNIQQQHIRIIITGSLFLVADALGCNQ